MEQLSAARCKLQAGCAQRRFHYRRRLLRCLLPVFFLSFLLGVGGWQLVAAPSALAAIDTGIDFGTATGLATTDIREIVARIIRAFLALLGIVAIVIVLAGGFLWMTSGGDENKIAKAKQLLTNGAIGLTIILLSFAITQFVLSRLLAAVSSGSVSVAQTGGGPGGAALSGALGAGPIDTHYPTRDATNIARNTRIFVTFRERVDPASFIDNTFAAQGAAGSLGTTGIGNGFDNYRDLARPEAIQIFAVGTRVDPTRLTPALRQSQPAQFWQEAARLVPVGVAVAADGRTISLTPVQEQNPGPNRTVAVDPVTGGAQRQFLGSANQPTAYVVRLTSAFRKADGTTNVFTGAFQEYTWSFTVSTTVDTTPPRVASVVPFPDSGQDAGGAVVGQPDQPRNVLVQMNFNEAMDPTVTTGTAPAFTIMGVQQQGQTAPVAGTYAITNQYQTVEFTTSAPCEQNSCGGTVFCLPGNAGFTASADAATIQTPGDPSGVAFSGIMDAAGNSLDGNGNGLAQGPGAPRFNLDLAATNAGATDSVQWQFFTTNTIDLSAPEIAELVHEQRDGTRIVTPRGGTLPQLQDISTTAPYEVVFSKLMSGSVASALGLEEIAIQGTQVLGCDLATGARCLWFTATMRHEDRQPPAGALDASRVVVRHDTLRDVQTGFAVPQYRSRIFEGARDVYQNCFFTVVDPVTLQPVAPRGPRGPGGGQSCIGVPGSANAGGQTCS